MWDDERCRLSPGDDWASRGRFKTFRHSFRPTSPLSLLDLDMWDTKSCFTAQASAWCGMASVTGSGFLSKVSTGTSGSTGGFRQNDPGVSRWRSVSRLAPEGAAPRSFAPSSGAELQRLREAHERPDNQTDLLKTRDTQLHHNTRPAQLLDMKQKQLSGAVSALEKEKEAAELFRFEESRRRGELQEKVLQLEMDMFRMRSTLGRGSSQPVLSERTTDPLSRTAPVSQEDVYHQEKQKTDGELCKLRAALRDAEEERGYVSQQLHSSKEAQKTLLSHVEEMEQRLSQTTAVQKELSEANGKVSHACLEKALLSTQLLKLEDNIEDLKAKLSGALSDKDHLIQEKVNLHQRVQGLELQLEKVQRDREGFTDQVCELHEQLAETTSHNNKRDQETVRMREELMSVREGNEKLTRELEMVKQRLEISQTQLHELTAETLINTDQITALEAERTRLIGEKEELLSKMNDDREAELTEMRGECCQLKESWCALELENQKLQDRCLCLESEVLEKEEELHLKVEGNRRLEAERVRTTEELRAVASHWNEKWQEVALALHSTQAELETFKKMDPRHELQEEADRLATEVENLQREGQKDKEEIQSLLQHKANMETHRAKKESESMLRVELDACRQELELERSRSQALLRRCTGKDIEAVQSQDKDTMMHEPLQVPTGSLISWQTPSDSNSSLPQVPSSSEECDGDLKQMKGELQKVQDMQSTRRQVQMLEEQLAQREEERRGKEHSLKSLKTLSDAERTEAQIKKLMKLNGKASGDRQYNGDRADVLTTDSLKAQLEESRSRADRLQQENNLAVQRLRTLRQCYPGKNEKAPLESKKDTTVFPVSQEQDKQRRMVTEQLKSLFKEREGGGKELEKVDDQSAAGQTGDCSLRDVASRSKVFKNALDTLHSQRCGQRERELRGTGGRSQQRGAGLTPVSEEQEEEEEEEEETGEEGEPQEVTHPKEESYNDSHQIAAMSVEISKLKGKNERLLPAKLKFPQPIRGLQRTTAPQPIRGVQRTTAPQPIRGLQGTTAPQLPAESTAERSSDSGVPNLSHYSVEGDLHLHGRLPPPYPDGLFQAKLVDVCSPDEGEEEEDKQDVT